MVIDTWKIRVQPAPNTYLDAFATIITQFLQIVSLSYHSRVKIEEINIGENTWM